MSVDFAVTAVRPRPGFRIVLAAAVLLAVLPAAQAQGPNLLKNGDFESEAATSPPQGWVMWGPDKWKDAKNYTCDTNQFHSGTASLRIFHPANTGGYIASSPFDGMVAEPGKAYEISLWAKTDLPGAATIMVQAASSLVPFTGAAAPLRREIPLDGTWRQFTYPLAEGYDFFASDQKHLFVTINATAFGTSPVEKTIWVDDVQLREIPRPESTPILENLARLPYTPVNHRLVPGDSLVLNLDAKRTLRPVNRDVTAVSFHRVAGYTGLPYNGRGEYKLSPDQEEAIRALRLSHTRIYGLGDEPFSLNDALDKTAFFLEKTGVPQAGTALELEDQHAERQLTPQQWADGVGYAVKKGYNFHYWEITNEPYVNLGKPNLYPKPNDYIAHAEAVSPAIRRADPDAKIGIAFEERSVEWGNQILKRLAGKYDFVAAHWYSFLDPTQNPFEMVVAGENYRVCDRIARYNALLKAYNPGRDVFQYDTEWSLHSHAGGARADDSPQNGNITGSLFRAVRLIYYVREGLLRGASCWEMFSAPNHSWNAFALLPATGDKKSMLYWTHSTFNEHLGVTVLDVDGTAPYYQPTAPANPTQGIPLPGPLTPCLATLSADGNALFLTVVNASWDKSIPCTVNLKNFAAKAVAGTRLSNDDVRRQGLLDSKDEYVSDFPAQLQNGKLECTLPPHSAVFLTLTK